LLFSAQDPAGGRELWKSDGTEAGTNRVKDINAGSASSTPASLTIGNSGLYFAATGDATGREVWKTDGTEAGTVPVTDLNPASGSGGLHPIFDVTAVGDLVFFVLAKDGFDRQLWRTDGSAAGTFMVGDHTIYESPTNVNGTLYIDAYVQGLGWELWKSDGSVAGTVLVKDIFPGAGDGSFNFFEPFVHLDGVLIFHANDGTSGLEPWRSDGTPAGTVRIADLNTGAGSSSPTQITEVGKSIYFVADDGLSGEELWTSNGEEANTVRVKDIFPGSVPSRPRRLTDNSGVLFMAARGPSASVVNPQLWKSDGTQVGTVLVKDGIVFPFLGSEEIVAINGIVYFNAGPTTSDIELWRSDGTQAGTTRVKDIRVGSLGSFPARLTALDNTLYFLANDGITGGELWKSDGTEAGTLIVKDIRPGPGSSTSTSNPRLSVDGVLYFLANDGVHGTELWKTDGTETGTIMVRDVFPGPGTSNIRSMANVAGTLFFDADDGVSGRELWKTDGTEAGTTLVKDIRPGAVSSVPRALTSVRDALFFLAIDGVTGVELWTSDGTAEGTRLVKDLDPGIAPSQPEFDFAIIDGGFGKCLFAASDGFHGLELWRSDGTADGTVLIADIAPGPAPSSPKNLTLVGSRLFFSAVDNVIGRELYELPGVAVQLPEAAVRALSDHFHGLGRNRRVPPALLDEDPFIVGRF
jgi:ELWxxDGT repeat protein